MTHHPLINIATWRTGCSCAPSSPGECLECTEGLIASIERWFTEQDLSPTGRHPSQPMLPDEPNLQLQAYSAGAHLVGADFSGLEKRVTTWLGANPAKPYETLSDMFGTLGECDPLDPAVLSAMMPGPAPAGDGPNRQLEVYAMAASDVPQWLCSGNFDAGQAQATIQEMGELIDQQAAEIARLNENLNYMTSGCTCNRADGIPVETVNEIRGPV